LTKEQVAKLDGFDKVFIQADKDNDGKLNKEESGRPGRFTQAIRKADRRSRENANLGRAPWYGAPP
jgi:hypothetical protein